MLKRAFSVADRNDQDLVLPPTYTDATRGSGGSSSPLASTWSAAASHSANQQTSLAGPQQQQQHHHQQQSPQPWQSSSQSANGGFEWRHAAQGQSGHAGFSAVQAGTACQPVASTSSSANPGRSAATFVPDDKDASSPKQASRASSTTSRRHSQKQSLDKGREEAEPQRLRPWTPVVPPDAQKALAEVQLAADNKTLSGVYSIECNTLVARADNGGNNRQSNVCPTASFTAANRSDVDVTLYFRPSAADDGVERTSAPPLPPRGRGNAQGLPPQSPMDVPLAITLKLHKGKARLCIPDRIPWRPLRIICILECARGIVFENAADVFSAANAHVSLPVGFTGKLAIWAPQGSIELSEPLRLNSTIVPSTQNNAHIVVYFISPDPSRPDTCPSHPTVAKTIDLCQVNTSKGRVRVDYAKPVRRSTSSKDSGCQIM